MEGEQAPVAAEAVVEEVAPVEAVEVEETEVAEAPKEPVEPPIPKGVQKRIDRAVREQYKARAEADQLRKRLEALESSNKPKPETDDKAPSIDQYDNLDEYVAAKAKYIASQEINNALTEREKRQAAERDSKLQSETVENWNKKVAAVTEELPDYYEVIEEASHLPMSDAMREAILTSDIGPKIAYHLATHTDDAIAISEMSPIAAIRALTRLEDKLSSTAAKTSAATAPITPVGQKAKVSKSPSDMTDSEFAKWRLAQIKNRR
jgi:hypothetical protein